MGKKRKKRGCRSPDTLSGREVRELMRHDAYERGRSGAMRSRRGKVVIK